VGALVAPTFMALTCRGGAVHSIKCGIPLGRVALLVFGMAVPMAAAAAQDQGPCAQIRAACQGVGFIQGAAREGIGLQIHCIMPIMQARAQPLTARRLWY
jgi:hypothetical protein